MTNAYTPCNAEGCDRSPVRHDVLYRVAPKGQQGPWACAEHVLAEREAWALDPDDLSPMTPEQIAWVRGQRFPTPSTRDADQ